MRVGERTAPNAGVSSFEVFKLEAPPDSLVTPDAAAYDDGVSSTWGYANVYGGGTVTQDLSGLRTMYGDVSCDGAVNIGDALIIAQFTVGLRTDIATCGSASVGIGEAHVGAGDVNFDGSTDIVDALVIARCEVGLVNDFCPTP